MTKVTIVFRGISLGNGTTLQPPSQEYEVEKSPQVEEGVLAFMGGEVAYIFPLRHIQEIRMEKQ